MADLGKKAIVALPGVVPRNSTKKPKLVLRRETNPNKVKRLNLLILLIGGPPVPIPSPRLKTPWG
jgi:hypothetical protein